MALVSPTERNAWFQAAPGVVLTATQIAFLDLIQPWVERVIYSVIGYTLEAGTATEFLPPSGGQKPPIEFGIDIGWDLVGGVAMPRSRMDPANSLLALSYLPVRSITSVYENISAWVQGDSNGTWPSSSLLPASAYRLDYSEAGLCSTGLLLRTVGTWTTVPRCVKVTYSYGYSGGEIAGTGLGEVKLALLEGLGWWWGKALQRSNAIKSNMQTALSLTIRDFSVTLGSPDMMSGADKGAWALNMLGPTTLQMLMKRVNLAQYFR
jgi:hypothetical protein